MPRHRSWNQSRCLVTGATSGLGRVLAEHLVRAGASVVLTGRSADRLCAVAQRLIEEGANPARLVTISADLTVQDDCQRLFDEVAGRFDALDVLINCAGVGADGQFETHDPTVLQQVFEINVFALADVCRRALPLLTLGNQPVVVNMGSVVARRGLPGRSEYSASKFAVTGFTEAIRVERRRFGIHVLQVNPGFADTPFDQHLVANTARYSVAHLRVMAPDAVARATIMRHRAAQTRNHAHLARQALDLGQHDCSPIRRLGADALAVQILPRRAGAPEKLSRIRRLALGRCAE